MRGCKRCGQPAEATIHTEGMVSSSHAFVAPDSGVTFPDPGPQRPEPLHPVMIREGSFKPIPEFVRGGACDFFKTHPHERYHFHGSGKDERIHWNPEPEGHPSTPLDRDKYGYTSALPLPTLCKIAPKGWRCTRLAGHSGPCAAVPSEPKGPRSLRERLGLWLMALGRRVSGKG